VLFDEAGYKELAISVVLGEQLLSQAGNQRKLTDEQISLAVRPDPVSSQAKRGSAGPDRRQFEALPEHPDCLRAHLLADAFR